MASCLLHLGELGDEGVRVRHLGALDRTRLEVSEHLEKDAFDDYGKQTEPNAGLAIQVVM